MGRLKRFGFVSNLIWTKKRVSLPAPNHDVTRITKIDVDLACKEIAHQATIRTRRIMTNKQ